MKGVTTFAKETIIKKRPVSLQLFVAEMIFKTHASIIQNVI